MSKIGIYVRVSREKQKEIGLSIPDQIQRGVQVSNQMGYKEYEVFQDEAFSGSLPIDKRPGLSNLISKIMDGQIHGVFVTEWDRLSRGGTIHTELLKSIFKENNIRVFELSGEIKLDDINQELLTDIKALLASFEVKKTSARIKRVLERNVIDGKVGGGPLLNYGYKKDDNNKLVLHEFESKIVQRIFQMALKGMGTKLIADALNNEMVPTKRHEAISGGNMKVRGKNKNKESFVWRDAVVYKIITNPIYKGHRLYKGKHYPCPFIVSEGVFDTVQIMMKERRKFMDTTNKYHYMLKGLLYCKKCGGTMYGRKREDLSDNQYICTSQRFKGEYCGNRGINIDHCNKLVWDNLMTLDKDVLKFYDWYEKNDFVMIQQGFLDNLEGDKKDAEKQIQNLIRLGAFGNIPDKFFQSEMERLNKWNNDLSLAIDKTKKNMQTLDDKDDVIDLIKKHLSPLRKKELSESEKSKICQLFIDKIEIQFINSTENKHSIHIDYKIDVLTQFKLAARLEMDYKKSGFALKKNNVFKTNLIVKKTISPFDDVDLTQLNTEGRLHPYMTRMLKNTKEIPPVVLIDYEKVPLS